MRKSIHSTQYTVFCERLIAARTRAGLTQTELAKRLRMTQSAVSKVERGERRVDVIELLTWCRALGTTLSEFGEGLEEELR